MFKVILGFFLCVTLANCANILGYFPTCSISHQVIFQPIWKELSLRGHRVTVITPNPLKDPSLTNLTEIDVSYMYEKIPKIVKKMMAKMDENIYSQMIGHFEVMRMFEEEILGSKGVLELLGNKNLQFDLVMMEMISNIGLGFGHKYKAPVVGKKFLIFLKGNQLNNFFN